MLMSCLTSRGQVGQQTSAPAFPLAEMAVIASFKLQVLDWFHLVVCNSKNWVGPFFETLYLRLQSNGKGGDASLP